MSGGRSAAPGHRDQGAVGERLDVGDRHPLARLDAAHDLDLVAEPLANLQLAHGEPIALHDEHAIDAVPILKRGIRQGQHVVHLAAFDVHPGKRPGLQHGLGVRHHRLERKGPRRGVHRRADPGHLAGERPIAVRVDAQFDGTAVRNPGGHLLGDLGDHLQRIEPDDRHDRHLGLDQLAQVDQPLLDVAIEGSADLGVAQLPAASFMVACDAWMLALRFLALCSEAS